MFCVLIAREMSSSRQSPKAVVRGNAAAPPRRLRPVLPLRPIYASNSAPSFCCRHNSTFLQSDERTVGRTDGRTKGSSLEVFEFISRPKTSGERCSSDVSTESQVTPYQDVSAFIFSNQSVRSEDVMTPGGQAGGWPPSLPRFISSSGEKVIGTALVMITK